MERNRGTERDVRPSWATVPAAGYTARTSTCSAATNQYGGRAAQVLVVAVAAVLIAMGRWRKVGFRAPRRPQVLLWFVVPLLPVAVDLVPGVEFVDALTVTGCWRWRWGSSRSRCSAV